MLSIIDLDLERENLADLEDIVTNCQPYPVGISALTLSAGKCFWYCAKRQKSIIAKYPHGNRGTASIIPAGINSERSDRSIDIVVVGEGEDTMLDIAGAKQLEQIEGIYFWSNGRYLSVQHPPT